MKKKIKNTHHLYIGLFQKKNKIGWGLKTWNSQGCHCQSGISRNDQKKMWSFRGSWFLVLEFPRDVTQFCTISSVFFFSGIAHCI